MNAPTPPMIAANDILPADTAEKAEKALAAYLATHPKFAPLAQHASIKLGVGSSYGTDSLNLVITSPMTESNTHEFKSALLDALRDHPLIQPYFSPETLKQPVKREAVKNEDEDEHKATMLKEQSGRFSELSTKLAAHGVALSPVLEKIIEAAQKKMFHHGHAANISNTMSGINVTFNAASGGYYNSSSTAPTTMAALVENIRGRSDAIKQMVIERSARYLPNLSEAERADFNAKIQRLELDVDMNDKGVEITLHSPEQKAYAAKEKASNGAHEAKNPAHIVASNPLASLPEDALPKVMAHSIYHAGAGMGDVFFDIAGTLDIKRTLLDSLSEAIAHKPEIKESIDNAFNGRIPQLLLGNGSIETATPVGRDNSSIMIHKRAFEQNQMHVEIDNLHPTHLKELLASLASGTAVHVAPEAAHVHGADCGPNGCGKQAVAAETAADIKPPQPSEQNSAAVNDNLHAANSNIPDATITAPVAESARMVTPEKAKSA